MSAIRKPRGDSHLKTLPDERQEQIIEFLRMKSLAEVRNELRNDGLHTSIAALSEFYSWWHLRKQFREAEQSSNTMMELLKAEQPALSEEEIFRYGQRVFQLRAMESESVKDWARIQAVALRKERLHFDREKFRQSIKTAIERGLDALYEEVKHQPEALQLFEQLKEAVMKGVAGAK